MNVKGNIVTDAIANAIKEVGSIPSGHLYAMLMPFGCSLSAYNTIVDKLKSDGKITINNHLIHWVGGK